MAEEGPTEPECRFAGWSPSPGGEAGREEKEVGLGFLEVCIRCVRVRRDCKAVGRRRWRRLQSRRFPPDLPKILLLVDQGLVPTSNTRSTHRREKVLFLLCGSSTGPESHRVFRPCSCGDRNQVYFVLAKDIDALDWPAENSFQRPPERFLPLGNGNATVGVHAPVVCGSTTALAQLRQAGDRRPTVPVSDVATTLPSDTVPFGCQLDQHRGPRGLVQLRFRSP